MGDLKIHIDGDKDYVEIDGELFDYIDLLELASRKSFEVSEVGLSFLLDIVDIARMIAPDEKEINFIQQSVRELILRNFIIDRPTEFDVHRLAEREITKIIVGSKIANITSDSKHQPDLWISWMNENIPVEVKLKEFNSNALEQLERYMEFYSCGKGIAIGESLTVGLPKNIKFISIKELKNAQ